MLVLMDLLSTHIVGQMLKNECFLFLVIQWHVIPLPWKFSLSNMQMAISHAVFINCLSFFSRCRDDIQLCTEGWNSQWSETWCFSDILYLIHASTFCESEPMRALLFCSMCTSLTSGTRMRIILNLALCKSSMDGGDSFANFEGSQQLLSIT